MRFIKTTTILSASLLIFLFSNCSRKNYTSKTKEADQEESVEAKDPDYRPAPVIYVPDEKAKTNKQGEMYYDNEYGYRYWRFCDGKYYLDAKYDEQMNTSVERPSAKYKKEKSKKKKKKKHQEYEDDEE